MPKKKEKKKRPTTVRVSQFTVWTDHRGLHELVGIRRSLAYYLVATVPSLKSASVNIKSANEKRGIRLWNVPKFRAFIESKVTP